MRGWGACDIREPNKDLGWQVPPEGRGFRIRISPEWSLRSQRFYRIKRKAGSDEAEYRGARWIGHK